MILSFDWYRKRADEAWEKFRSSKDKASQQERDRFYQLYVSYSIVVATWSLAITTIILSLLTLSMK